VIDPDVVAVRRQSFSEATLADGAFVDWATFTGTGADGARVVNLDIAHQRLWPRRWTVRVDPDDPTSGRLVRDDTTPPGEPDTTVSRDQEGGEAQSTVVSG
jgi:hypothetical protein